MKRSLLIRTPEGVEFSHVLASPLIRSLALIIDLACISVASGTLGTVAASARVINPDIAIAVTTVLYFAVGIGYGILTEWCWRGQTIGKRLFRLRVIDASGLRLEFAQIVVRNLLRAVDALPAFYLVGGVVAWFSPRCQRLGDLAAGTVVVRSPSLKPVDLDQVNAGRFNSLRAHPHLEARLRQRVTPAEAAIYLQAVLRRDEFDPAERLALFRTLADRLKTHAAFPEETVEHLTPEQYVRNAVEILFTPSGSGSSAAANGKQAKG